MNTESMNTENQFDLHGRVALITGASSYGIGSGAARLLAQKGAKVFIVARREDKLKEMAASIESDGGTVGYKAIDVSDEEECKAAVEACVKQFGQLDIMVLSAGIAGQPSRGDLDKLFDTDNWKDVLGINLDGIFYMIKHGYKECAKGGVGSIIPIASLAAFKAAGSIPYTASKGAIRSLTKLLGNLFGPLSIRVNTVYPGMIDTDMTHGAVANQDYLPGILKTIPLNRVGTVDDIAKGILYLASDASSFMTGQDLIIDGGNLC